MLTVAGSDRFCECWRSARAWLCWLVTGCSAVHRPVGADGKLCRGNERGRCRHADSGRRRGELQSKRGSGERRLALRLPAFGRQAKQRWHKGQGEVVGLSITIERVSRQQRTWHHATVSVFHGALQAAPACWAMRGIVCGVYGACGCRGGRGASIRVCLNDVRARSATHAGNRLRCDPPGERH